METQAFEPKLIGFLCRWCSYQGADLAGSSRLQFAPNLIPIKVMCSGRVDPTFVLEAFKKGADGVAIFGCHPGDCHYSDGNYYTRRRLALLAPFLNYLGVEPERLRLEWVSASEGKRFSTLVSTFTQEVASLGPRGNHQGGETE